MIHVVIDTSIYRQDASREKASFITFSNLCKSDVIKLHLPAVVKDEFITQIPEFTEPLSEAISKIRSFSSKKSEDETKHKLKGVEKDINEIKTNYEKTMEAKFNNWILENKAELHSIKPHHGESVLKSYFMGHPPFKKVKNRDDFPDAFIWQNLLDLVQKYGQIHFVVADNRLCDACNNNSKIKVYKLLDQLIESEQLKDAIIDTFAEKYFIDIIAFLSANPNLITDSLQKNIAEELAYKEIHDERIPDDNNEGIITMVDEGEDFEYRFDQTTYYGSGILVIPFSFTTECLVEYHIFKADYYSISEKRLESISVSEYDNKHYFEAEEYMPLLVIGTISVKFPSVYGGIEKEDVSQLLKNAEIRIDKIDNIVVAEQLDHP